MPYKDKQKRNEAIRKSQAKRPEHYRKLRLGYKREACRRGYYVKHHYGMSEDDYQALLKKQDGHCAICGNIPKPTKSGRSGLYVDHCHTTGKVRGLLCCRCNQLMGFVDQPNWTELIAVAQEYKCQK